MPDPPRELGPYRLVRPLGQGGMGTVWLAHDRRLDRDVALKLLFQGEATSTYHRALLLREAQAAAALNHPNIASVHDVLEVDGQVAIVFEYVAGETLASRLARGPLPADAAIGIAGQLAQALARAHDQGIVHRDLKPANIVITPDGTAKVLDFGVARVMPPGADSATRADTSAAGFVGTVGYAAPEQCLGQSVDARADVFSLGVVLFEMLTGDRPFPGSSVTAVVRSMLQDHAPRLQSRVTGVASELDALIASMLAVEAAARPATARDVAAVLSQIAPTKAEAAPTLRPRRRRVSWLAMAVVAILVGIAVASLRTVRPDPAPARAPVVAVLPLTNASGDAAKEYLAVGVADSLVTRLAGLPAVTVLSRAAVADARRRQPDLAALARELDATYLVEGSVQEADARLRITLTLLRRDVSVVWADTVEGSFDTVFDLQTRLASALAQALSVQLSAADRAAIAQQPTRNAEALGAYWRGRALLERRDIAGNPAAALAALDEAITLDPRFADAYAARGEALWLMYNTTREPALAQAAVEAGLTALRIDPGRPEVRYSVALTLKASGQLDQAIDELQRALALRPNYDDARRELGDVLAQQGRMDEAVAEFEKAIAIRPNYWAHHHALGTSHLRNANYEAAAAAFAKVIALQPDNVAAQQNLGAAYHYMGRLDDALAAYQRALAIRPSALAYANAGAIYHRRGRYEEAIAAYQEALRLRPNLAATHRNLGDAYQQLGRRREARAAYREAVRLASEYLTVNPRDAEAMASVAVYAAKAGDRDLARQRLREARAQAPANVQVLHRGAVVHALAGEAEAALALLEAAVAGGYSKTEIAEDEDFRALRAMPRFRTLLAGASIP